MMRQMWLQRNQAAAIINALSEAMGGGSKKEQHAPQHRGMRTPPQGNKVSGGALLGMMGKRYV